MRSKHARWEVLVRRAAEAEHGREGEAGYLPLRYKPQRRCSDSLLLSHLIQGSKAFWERVEIKSGSKSRTIGPEPPPPRKVHSDERNVLFQTDLLY